MNRADEAAAIDVSADDAEPALPGATATYSPEDNKLRLYAQTRLDAEMYKRVDDAGFKWAPRQKLFVAPMWTPARVDLLVELCGEIGDEDTSLVDRAEERADRFEGYSDNRAADADAAHKAVARANGELNPDTLDFVAAVTARYIETGADLTVPEIATALGWKVPKVRRLLTKHGGCPNGLVPTQAERPSYSRNYRNMQSGVHRIWVYAPTRETLRVLLTREQTKRDAEALAFVTPDDEVW